MSTPPSASRRKPYARPRLAEHGDVARVTGNTGKVSANPDNSGMGASVKTA